MPKSLPYKRKPVDAEKHEVGYDKKTSASKVDYGSIEIPKYYSLTEKEVRFVEEKREEFQVSNFLIEGAKLAVKISQEKGTDLKIAFEQIQAMDYSAIGEDLPEVLRLANKVRNDNLLEQKFCAFAILKFRLGLEIELDDLDDTEFIHPQLVKDVAWFYARERDNWAAIEEIEDEPKELTSEQIKKLPAAK